jgi:HEAT repeat protein
MSDAYHGSVAQLLTLGHPHQNSSATSEWRDYLALGLTADQIPELVRMALDQDLRWADSEGSEVWAPLHAWRALGQLRAESAVAPLLRLLDRVDVDEDDWLEGDLPKVFGMIGPPAVPGLRAFLADAAHGEWARITAGECLKSIVEQFPETCDLGVAILTDQLRRFDDQERIVNACLVETLCDLKAVESAPVIEQAYAAGAVDLSVLGDWEEAQILLGLIEKRVTPAPNFLALEWGLPSFSGALQFHKPAPHKASKQKKAKRKQEKASRKRNRKR